MLRLLGLGILLLLTATVGHAETWPTRPVRLIVPIAPGGSTDVVARLLAQELGTELKQSVVVDNRAGGGTNVGVELAAQAAPDGYTLLMASTTQAINVTLYKSLPYNLLRDFVPVAPAANSPSLLVVHPSVRADSVAALLALARARPGDLTYASSGNGSTAHLAGELFKTMAGIDLVHVPYKGAGPAMADVVGGHVNMMFGFTAGVLPFTRAGQLRPLAVTSAARLADMPELPTVAEAGLPGFEVLVWYGLMAPTGTPASIVAQLHGAAAAGIPRIAPKLIELGAYPLASSAADFGRFIAAEIDKWAPIVRKTQAQID